MVKRIVFQILSLCCLTALIATNRLYRQQLFDITLSFVPILQKSAGETQINFWTIYTDVAYALVNYVPIGIFYLIYGQRERSFYYLLAWAGNGYLLNLTKLSYHAARPFWVSQEIQALDCTGQFGNPSGHSMVTFGRPLLLWLDYQQNCNNGVFSYKLMKTIIFVISIAFGLSVGYSRLFLGVHSLDQVVFGYALGAWYSFTMHFCMRPYLMQHLTRLLH